MKRDGRSLLHQITRFEGVLCSGFFIPDPALVTALSLIFDRVHYLNQLEYAIELSKRVEIQLADPTKLHEIRIEAQDGRDEDPLASLTCAQRETALAYLYLADEFLWRYALLFPDVFRCSLLPNGEVLTATLIKKGTKGRLNTYNVRKNPLTVCTGGDSDLNRLISEGKIPIVAEILPTTRSKTRYSASQVASTLALKAVAMVLPATKAADSDTILEARERLRDHLPPFWSAMLKLSAELTQRLGDRATDKQLQLTTDDAVATIVRPALIDLVAKLEKERKLWFYRVLSPVAKGLRLVAGKPPTDLAGLVSSSLLVGADVGLDVANQLRHIEALKQQSGLTYLLELHKAVR
jgi:hypothetical protein